MQAVTLFLFLSCALIIVAAWLWARHASPPLAQALLLGFVGGLLGTIGYDLIRIPFLIAGQRVFAPISAYGVWLADAAVSNRWTEVLGWSYHFSNGITFGIMYALFMRGRHWGWAVAWAFLLETIAVVSPFADIFSLRTNYGALGIAYLGHVAYGVPLGLVVQHWERSLAYLRRVPREIHWFALLIWLLALLSPAFSPARSARNERAVPQTFVIEGKRLNPNWLRLERGERITVRNPGPEPAVVVRTDDGTRLELPPGSAQLSFPQAGVMQIYVETVLRTRSSFVIVEPVESVANR